MNFIKDKRGIAFTFWAIVIGLALLVIILFGGQILDFLEGLLPYVVGGLVLIAIIIGIVRTSRKNRLRRRMRWVRAQKKNKRRRKSRRKKR